jgi:hypothetical protein
MPLVLRRVQHGFLQPSSPSLPDNREIPLFIMSTDGSMLERLDLMMLDSYYNALRGIAWIVKGIVLLGEALMDLLLVIFIIDAIHFALLAALPLRAVLAL